MASLSPQPLCGRKLESRVNSVLSRAESPNASRFPQPIEVERKPRRDTNAQHPFRSPIRQAVSPPRKPIERNKSPKPVRDDLGTVKKEGDRKSRKEDVERLNQEIRRMNSLDNLRVNKSLTKKKKNLRDYMVSPKKEGQLKRQKSPPKEQADRRNELGIGFLNELEMNKIKKLIQKEKEKSKLRDMMKSPELRANLSPSRILEVPKELHREQTEMAKLKEAIALQHKQPLIGLVPNGNLKPQGTPFGMQTMKPSISSKSTKANAKSKLNSTQQNVFNLQQPTFADTTFTDGIMELNQKVRSRIPLMLNPRKQPEPMIPTPPGLSNSQSMHRFPKHQSMSIILKPGPPTKKKGTVNSTKKKVRNGIAKEASQTHNHFLQGSRNGHGNLFDWMNLGVHNQHPQMIHQSPAFQVPMAGPTASKSKKKGLQQQTLNQGVVLGGNSSTHSQPSHKGSGNHHSHIMEDWQQLVDEDREPIQLVPKMNGTNTRLTAGYGHAEVGHLHDNFRTTGKLTVPVNGKKGQPNGKEKNNTVGNQSNYKQYEDGERQRRKSSLKGKGSSSSKASKQVFHVSPQAREPGLSEEEESLNRDDEDRDQQKSNKFIEIPVRLGPEITNMDAISQLGVPSMPHDAMRKNGTSRSQKLHSEAKSKMGDDRRDGDSMVLLERPDDYSNHKPERIQHAVMKADASCQVSFTTPRTAKPVLQQTIIPQILHIQPQPHQPPKNQSSPPVQPTADLKQPASPVLSLIPSKEGPRSGGAQKVAAEQKIPAGNPKIQDMRFAEDEPTTQTPGDTQSGVQDLARDEYKRWSLVRSIVHQIDEKLGAKAASDVKDLFSKLNTLTNQYKRILKDGFLPIGAEGLAWSGTGQGVETRSQRADGALALLGYPKEGKGQKTDSDLDNGNGAKHAGSPRSVGSGLIKSQLAYKRGEPLEVWPEVLPRSITNSPRSLLHKSGGSGLQAGNFGTFNGINTQMPGLSVGTPPQSKETFSDRQRSKRSGRKLLAGSGLLFQPGGSQENMGKIKILDQFENKHDRNPPPTSEENQSGLSSGGSRKQGFKPVQLFNNNGPLQALNSVELQQSELSPMLKESEFLPEGILSQVVENQSIPKANKSAHMLISNGLSGGQEISNIKIPEGLAQVLSESDIIEGDLEDLKSLHPVLDNNSNVLGANISFLDQIPGKYQLNPQGQTPLDEAESSVAQEYQEEKKSPYSSSVNGGMPKTIPNLRKYVEGGTNDTNWLANENSEGGGKGVVNRDTSFEQEVISCRQKFLADSISDHILEELIAEVKADPLFFKQSPTPAAVSILGDGKVTLNLLEDPRYISESSEEETVYGIRTNMNAVFEYCNLLVRFISDHYLDLLLEKYNTKVGQRPDKMLQEIRMREIGLMNSMTPWTAQLSAAQKNSHSATKAEDAFLPEFIFNRLEEEIISNYDNLNIMQNLFDMQRVYHKSIFDCLNEILVGRWRADQEIDYFKVIVNGKQHTSRPASTTQEMEALLNSAKDMVVEFSTMMCGLIKDKEDSLIGNIRLMNLEKIELIREERLFRFLCFEAIEMEKKFTNYTMDEVYSLIDCSEAVFETLVEEVIYELLEIKEKS